MEIFLRTLQSLSGPETLALMCGVPLPPADQEKSIVEEFLSCCPRFFDSYLPLGRS